MHKKIKFLRLLLFFYSASIIFAAENIAKNKKWTCSDTNPQYTAGFWAGLTDGNLTDNNKNTFSTGSGEKLPKTIIIDLAAKCLIENIKIHNSQAGGTKTVEVLISEDNRTYFSVGKKVFENYDPAVFEISFINKKNINYIQIIFHDKYPVGFKNKPSGYLFLKEVEVFGRELEKSNAKKPAGINPAAADLAGINNPKKEETGNEKTTAYFNMNYSFNEEMDVVYGKGGNTDLLLDNNNPQNTKGKRPALLVIHGGGWIKFDKKNFSGLSQEYTKMGFVVFNINYRLAKDAPAPAALEDAKCASRFIHAHADKYNIDAGRIAVIGGSAGSHLAMMVGLCNNKKYEGSGGWNDQPSTVAAVINRFGITDVYDLVFGENLRDWAKEWIGTGTEQLTKEMSPIFYVKEKNPPPVLTIHGSSDTLVPFYQALKFHVLMTEAGQKSVFYNYPGGAHGLYAVTMYSCLKPELDREVKIKTIEFLINSGILE